MRIMPEGIAIDHQMLARILKECVSEAAALKDADAEALIAQAADADAEQPEMPDVLELELSGLARPIKLAVHVDRRPCQKQDGGVEHDAMIDALRLAGQQDIDQVVSTKAYSVWIVPGPNREQVANSFVRLAVAQQYPDGRFEHIPEDTQIAEAWVLYLGDPDDTRVDLPLLRMLDIAFSEKMQPEEKLRLLREDYSMRV